VAIDIAHYLNLPLYDPDTPLVKLDPANGGNVTYTPIKPGEPATTTQLQRPANGNAVIGGTGQVVQGKTDGNIVIAANGGSDLIYLPNGNPTMSNGKSLAETLVDFLSSQDYISGVFADDSFGKIPGALPLSAINLKGSALTPIPAIVVNFSTFSTDQKHPFQTGVEIADSGLQQGQGMHGSFSRADTYNNMAAIGPDFKHGFKDLYPVSNADVPLTVASILNIDVPYKGKLHGRVIKEALAKDSKTPNYSFKVLRSETNPTSKQRTVLYYQTAGKTRYFDAAGFPGRTVGLVD